MAARGRALKWIIGGVVVVAVLAVAVPYAYIHFIQGKAPAPLHLRADRSSPATGSGGGDGSGGGTIAGSWQPGSGSVVGYRVKEVLVGQDNIAVGRTHSVTGHLVISGTTVTSAAFTVPMDTIHSDESQRDAQFDGRIMDVTTYPTGTFTLTKPIAIGSVPAVGQVRTYSATGELTLHGHTKQVTFPLSAERTAAGLKVSGSIPVLFADWDIPNPSFGSFVTTQNHGVLEFLLALTKS